MDTPLYIGESLDDVSSGQSDNFHVLPHLSIPPSPRHPPGVEVLAASPHCTLAAQGQVHAANMGGTPGQPRVVLTISQARVCQGS